MRNVFTVAALAAGLFVAGLSTTGTASAANVNLTGDGTWISADESMTAPAFFTDSYTAPEQMIVRLTDWAVVSDLFEVYVNSNYLMSSTIVGDWTTIGGLCTNPSSAACGYTSNSQADLDGAYAGGVFSTATFWVAAGDVVTIRNVSIPPVADLSGPFPDGTMAISAIPEPATMAVLGAGLLGLGWARRRPA